MREMIGQMLATAAILNVAEAVNLGREEGFDDIVNDIGGYQWSAILDDHTCPICESLDGTYFEPGDPALAELKPPIHPNCLVNGSSQVYTSKGWKRIMDIEKGELVLTHRGRFRKVLKTFRHRYNGGVTKVWFGGRDKFLTLTDEHPVLVKNKWVYAKDIKREDTLSILGNPCKRCGKITINPLYCSHTCNSLDITKKQWSNSNHRKNVSCKARAQMKKEYANGSRDPYKITEAAHKAVLKLSAEGRWNFMNPTGINRWAKSKEGRAQSSKRMTENNPSCIPEVRKRMTESHNRTLLLHPEKHPNLVMAKKGFISSIEKKVKEILDILEIKYTQQHPVGKFFVDFAVPSLMIAIEADGHHWHKDLKKDAVRQQIIEKKGWHVIRFKEDQINNNPQFVLQEVVRIAANHAGEYRFANVDVKKIERWNLKKPRMVYNLSVDEDESYIAKGMVVHNCRCILAAVLKEELQNFPVKFTFFEQDQVSRLLINKL